MMRCKYCLCLFVFFLPNLLHAQFSNKPGSFVPPRYTELSPASISPKGWLLNQLTIMRNGTTGHLDEVHDKIKVDNGWLGGKGDGWEETPYWLDGAVPLAYLLNDTALKRKVLQYINWTLDNQRPSGYFGPITKWEGETGSKITVDSCRRGEDWWPKMIMLKVLQQFYLATNDQRVIPFMTKYFDYQLKSLKSCPLVTWTEWAQARGPDNALMIQWLYSITREQQLLSLSELIQKQAIPWSQLFYGRDWVINAAAYQDHVAWMTRHGVNVGMGIKDPVVHYQRTGDTNYLKAFRTCFNDLLTLHGLPFGIFSADEDLHGNMPTQGTELCATVEAMYSLENAIAITGETRYMDALEKMTFNALPGQTTDDYNNKQYFQIANQVHIKRGIFTFSLPFGREMNNVLGMKSGYTCCLANMHQGWTKFASHLWYRTNDNGLAALLFSPSEVKASVGSANTEVTINETTSYPFDERVDFNFRMKNDVEFPFEFRIPSWCKEAAITINGTEWKKIKGGELVIVNRLWKNNDVLRVMLPMDIRFSTWGGNSKSVERGPLVYALKLKETWGRGSHEKEGAYFTVHTEDPWNYGLTEKAMQNPVEGFKVQKLKAADGGFVWNLAKAPIQIQTTGRRIPDWVIAQDVAPQPVTARDGLYMGAVSDSLETITLVPIGCTKVRIVAFPVVK